MRHFKLEINFTNTNNACPWGTELIWNSPATPTPLTPAWTNFVTVDSRATFDLSAGAPAASPYNGYILGLLRFRNTAHANTVLKLRS